MYFLYLLPKQHFWETCIRSLLELFLTQSTTLETGKRLKSQMRRRDLPPNKRFHTNNFLDCLKGWRSLGHEYWPCPSCEQSGRQVEVVVGIGEPVDWTTYMPPRTRPRVLNWPTPTFTTYKNCTFKTVLSPEHKATTGLSERSLSVAPTMIV